MLRKLSKKKSFKKTTFRIAKKLLWNPIPDLDEINDDHRRSTTCVWTAEVDRTLAFDRQLVCDLYFSQKAIARRQRRADDGVRKNTQLDAKQYQSLIVCLRGLRIDDRRLSATLACYHDLMLNTPFGLLKCEIKNFDENYLSFEECLILDEALPDFQLANDEANDAVDRKLIHIQKNFPSIKRDLAIIKYRLKVEQTMQKTCAAIVCCYHFILAFDEAYEGNLMPILHTVRSLGNLLNHGSYLGDARGFYLNSLNLLSTHNSIDKSETLMRRLQMIVEASDIDYTPLRRFYSRMIDPRDIHELKRQLAQSNGCLSEWLILKDRLDQYACQDSLLTENIMEFRKWARTFDELIQDRLTFITQNVTRIEKCFIKYDACALKKFLKILFCLPACEIDLFGATREVDVSCVELIYDLPGAGREILSPVCRNSSRLMSTPSTISGYGSCYASSDDSSSVDGHWKAEFQRRLESMVRWRSRAIRWMRALLSTFILRAHLSTAFSYLDILVDWISASSNGSFRGCARSDTSQYRHHVRFANEPSKSSTSRRPSSYGVVSSY